MTGLQSLPRVDPHVVFQFLFLGKHDMADGAGGALLARVGALVAVAGALVAERHLTELTLVRLDAQVDPYVSLQIALLHKLLWTVGTLMSWTCNTNC